jgi:hypothetical protein
VEPTAGAKATGQQFISRPASPEAGLFCFGVGKKLFISLRPNRDLVRQLIAQALQAAKKAIEANQPNLQIGMTMKLSIRSVAQAAAVTAALVGAGLVQAQVIPQETFRGQLPADLQLNLRLPTPAKVAVCPAGYHAVFANKRLSCDRQFVQFSDVKCPANFPNFTARNVAIGSDRDLCAKAGVNIASTGPLTGLINGTDFVFIPTNGVRNGVSFVAADATVSPADGWRVESTNANGITDRYRRVVTTHATPLLVAR